MADPFIGEIRMFAGNFAPRNWAFCDGQLIAISSNTALFSLIGAIYGGDGRTSFALPDLRGRVPIHQGVGPGLTPRPQGSRGGAEQHTLTTNELPAHSHTVQARSLGSRLRDPENRFLGASNDQYTSNLANIPMASSTTTSGGGQSHNNMQPSLGMNYIISLFGVFPSRS